MRFIDVTGKQFGMLRAEDWTRDSVSGRILWRCTCSCGNQVYVKSFNLSTTKSCGCYVKHGHSVGGRMTTEYGIWINMRSRCSNPKIPDWDNYGGRGITVCQEWQSSFESFYKDMGPRPKGKTLDRIDNNGNYEPNNCHWATAKEQAANKRVRTHCNKGHELSGDNVIYEDNGKIRRCKICRTISRGAHALREGVRADMV